MTTRTRVGMLAVAAAIVVAAVAVFVVFGTGFDDPQVSSQSAAGQSVVAGSQTVMTPTVAKAETSTQPPAFTRIQTRDGGPLGRPKAIKLKEGAQARIRVSSNVDQEIHLHGYDLRRQVAPGKPAEFVFAADITGVFEFESHPAHATVAELEVRP